MSSVKFDLDDLDLCNPRQKAKGPGYEHLFLLVDEMAYNLMQDFKKGKSLAWPVASKTQVHKIWSDFIEHGAVKDEQGLEQIFESIRDSFLRLKVANIVSGHTQQNPAEFLDDLLDENQYEPFCDWLIQGDGHWRVSDYGIEPLRDAIALAFETQHSAKKLKYLDRALHVTHMRGDLSRLFIEGGRNATLDLDLLRPDAERGEELKTIFDRVSEARLICSESLESRPGYSL